METQSWQEAVACRAPRSDTEPMKAALAILTLAFTPGFSAPTGQTASVAEGSDEQCGIALAFAQAMVAERKGRRVVFSDGVEFLPTLPTSAEWYSEAIEQNIPAPAGELVKAVSTRSAVAACGSLRDWLDARHIGYGTRAIDAATRDIPWNGEYRATLLGLSLPAVSADHRQAVLIRSSYIGPMGGGGSMIHLKRMRDRSWKAISEIGLYVS